ncbi:MAG: hypothetical protein U0974_01865 [Gemmatimonadales bacterium]|nr:hypothetical protein [Gemmatimonadales bacterium]
MRKSFQYKAKLSVVAAEAARGQLALCCELYNAALQERRDHWQQRGIAVTAVQQKLQLPSIKQVRPDLAVVGSQVLPDVIERLHRAQGTGRADPSASRPAFKAAA